AGVFAGLNTMHGAILGRTAELAMLQTVGFSRTGLLAGLIQEGVFLAAAASLTASALAIVLLNGVAVRFTMGAFPLVIDSTAILVGCATGLGLGILGTFPPAIRALRMPIVAALRSV
ncbi:MAG: FtsX-like permease family protein, partial [Thermoguttaceae bacterium]